MEIRVLVSPKGLNRDASLNQKYVSVGDYHNI